MDSDEIGAIDLTENADELQSAEPRRAALPTPSSCSLTGPMCIGLVQPSRLEEESLSTACSRITVQPSTPGGAQLGSGGQGTPHCFGQPPALPAVPSRPLPPMSSADASVQSTTAQSCPRILQPLGSRPKCPPSSSSPPGSR